MNSISIRRRLTSLAVMTIGAVLSVAVATSAAAEETDVDRLTQVDGAAIDGKIEAIEADGTLRIAGRPATISFADLLSIQRPAEEPALAAAPPPFVVELLGGGKLLANELTIREQQCQIRWPNGPDLSLPIELIAAIRLQPDLKDAAFAAALAQPKRDVDRLLVTAQGAGQWIDGLVESMDGKEVSFEWQGKSRKVPRADVRGIVLAVVGRPVDRTGWARVELNSGSSFWARIIGLRDGRLTVEFAPKAQSTIAWDGVRRLTIASSRLAYLSDLEPTEVVEQPIVTQRMPWQRDQSVAQHPLQVGNRKFARGLGVHARSQLRYTIDGKFDALIAAIGIDAETAGQGDCVFVVQGDGRELYRQRVVASDAARDIKVDVHGVRDLTLLVEPGEDLDLADHADWAEARLLRGGVKP
ncbi:MAG: NPCBM/NEW2 domain-containing protein [Planctomycetia bacterium]|nr:NPCBM/NEW2 domain-containing protein [Planctomycetia bacterium]